MKKQKFNGKLRLKKNVISQLNANNILGGAGGESPVGDPTDFCIPTDCTVCVCYDETQACTWDACTPGQTLNEECYSLNQSCACP